MPIASLPMRNWNKVAGLIFIGVHFIASLPMRNWNGGKDGGTVDSSKNCEPTYEELKYIYAEHIFSEGSNCEPTYEELKSS